MTNTPKKCQEICNSNTGITQLTAYKVVNECHSNTNKLLSAEIKHSVRQISYYPIN